MKGACTRNTSVKKKVGLFAGGLYAEGAYRRRNTVCSPLVIYSGQELAVRVKICAMHLQLPLDVFTTLVI